MIYDTTFNNLEEVKCLLGRCPGLGDFGALSEEVKELLFDAHDHLHAIAGYADWYIHRKVPPKIWEQALIGDDFWQRLNELRRCTAREADLLGLQKVEEIGHFVCSMSSLMFKC